MKFLKKGLLLTGLFLSLPLFAFAQQYTLRDQTEIAYQAQLSLDMYKDLLNVISYANLATESEIKELIKNSYSNSRAQIFYSGEAIIEDNVKPSNQGSGHKQDKTIKDYLNYFDLAYLKSDQETVSFYDFETSGLKFKNHLFIKVKYTSLFKGRHKEDTAAYIPTERVAEFRVEKKDGEWKTYITSIVYYTPEKQISSTEGDVKLDASVRDDGTFSRLISTLHAGSGSGSQSVAGAEEGVQKKEQDYLFNYYVETGETALAAGLYDDALLAFSEARRIYPADQDLQKKIIETGQAKNQKSNSPESRLENAKINADRAFAARDYLKAKELYSEVLRMNPQDKEMKEVISKTELIIRKTAIPESKYSVGQYKEAVKDYTKAIKEDKTYADYYLGRGKAYEKLDAVKDALSDYSKAIELDGNFIEALDRRAGLYTRTGELHSAIADYTLVISNPGYAPKYYPKRAEVKKKLGDLSGAIEDYNMAIRLSSEEPANYYEKGVILNMLQKPEEAVASFSETIKRDGSYKNAYYQRGLAHVALENLPEASADFARAREQGLEKDQSAEIYKLAFAYYSAGEEAMKNEKFEEAENNYAKALLISPEFGRAWLSKGDVHYILKDYGQAISSYSNAAENDSLSLAYFKRGRALQESGDVVSAVRDFKRFEPIGVQVVETALKSYGKKKDSAVLPESFPEEPADAWYALGYAQMMTKESQKALENLDLAIKERKFFPVAYFARGAAFYDTEDFKRAVKDMEEGIKQGLSDPYFFASLGKAYLANGQAEDAVLSYSHTLKLDPENEASYIGRALAYKKTGQYKKALEDVQTVLEKNNYLKEDVALMTTKGMLELYLKKFEEADNSFGLALGQDENHAWALYGKAGVLAHQGKTEEAMKLYSQAFQSKEISWDAIKKDSLIDPVKKEKAFKDLVKAYL